MKDFNIKNFDSVLKERRGSSKPGETSFQMPNSYSLIDNSHLKNLGFLNTRRANSHERDLKLETANAINDHKYRKIQALSVENLEHEVKLIREEMRIEFNRQYAALAEQSATSEITALQKFEAIGEAARDLLLDNRHGAFSIVLRRDIVVAHRQKII